MFFGGGTSKREVQGAAYLMGWDKRWVLVSPPLKSLMKEIFILSKGKAIIFWPKSLVTEIITELTVDSPCNAQCQCRIAKPVDAGAAT